MRKILFVCLLLSLLASNALLPTAGAQRQNENAIIHKHKQSIAGSYIIVFKDEVPAAAVEARANDLSRRYGGWLTHLYRHALRGFAVQLNEQAAEALARNPLVAYVEEDTVIELAATQQGAPWGLDRIDQRANPPSNTYTYANNGSGTRVYLIDSGIRTTHEEFEGRASVAFDNVGDGRNGQDCYGHGTQEAGIIGGKTYGVAKGAQLLAVRAFGCTNGSSATRIIGAIDWVTANHQKPAVAVMSASGLGNVSLDTAVRNSIGAGVPYVVAAGNASGDAGIRSPARVTEALTVGATDISDTRPAFSNYGAVLDLFAPGVDIPTTSHLNDTATILQSGTSMAAAHVAGTVARYLSGNPADNPAQVGNAVVGNATPNKVVNAGDGSPNLLLYRPQSKIMFQRDLPGTDALLITNRDGSNTTDITNASVNPMNYKWAPDGTRIAFESSREGFHIYKMNADGSGLTNLSQHPDYPEAENYNPSWSPDGTKLAFDSYRDDATDIYSVNQDGTNQTRLTSSAGYNYTPVWSPDGSKIAFISGRDGNAEIYVMNADGTNQMRLTNTTSNEGTPAWSPDGTRMAFHSQRDGNSEIYVMNADGSGQTRLTNNPASDGGFAWSPDGTKIAFNSDRSGNSDIYRMNADGTGVVNLTANLKDDVSPAWSPDGTKIAFQTLREGDWHIYLMDTNGANQTRLSGASNTYEAGGIAWSPDSMKVLYSSAINNGSYEFFTVNPDGSGAVNLSRSPAGDSGYVWSPDGRKIAFESSRGGTADAYNNDIYVMNSDGTGVLRLTSDPKIDSGASWSPDGTKIVFARYQNGGEGDVYVINADGTNETRLTTAPGWDYSPLWSPDGTKIVFISSRTYGNSELYVMNADGSNQVRITNMPYTESEFAWSPDSTRIAFRGQPASNVDIYVVNADGSNLQRLTTHATSDVYPAWSPDGTKIAFSSYRDGNENIYLMNADGTNQTRLTFSAAWNSKAAWSPDGLKLAFRSGRDSDDEIYTIDVDGNNTTRVTNRPGWDVAPVWQPL
ncbi:MAG TPA: S8 family serine peptidase [Pyrinomonadaceae bacterium]|nr:S8 family serine peptidase [Pyrinomonadaceae bacterium]